MKQKFTLVALAFFFAFTAGAVTIPVAVTNNQFTPANITGVQVGDVIQFNFVAGFHNAVSNTVANSVPVGAAEINSGAPSGTNPRTYSYTVTSPGVYHYVCIVHVGAGMVGEFTVDAILPAILKDFKVTPTAKSKPTIAWKTVSEANVNYFSIRSSLNGIDFKQVGIVAAKGNSASEQFYTYTDDNINTAARFVYYMVVIVDKDKRESHSDISLFKNMNSATQIVTELSPNPVPKPGHMMFKFNAEKNGELSAQVFDLSGKMIKDEKLSAFAGLNNGHIHMGGLPSGTYTIRFAIDGFTETRKVVVK